MPFIRTSPAPERVFLYGAAGAGKTSCIFSIARKLAATNSPARIHLVDTDNAYYDMIEEVPEAEEIVIPTLVDTSEEGSEWPELRDAIARAQKDADPKRGDWIAVDRIDPAWEWVQDFWAREAKNKEIDQLRAEGRKKVESGEDKNLRAGASGFEWAEIKSRFRKPMSRLMTSGCNIIVTAGEAKLSQYTDQDGSKSQAYGGLPWGAAGGAGTLLLTHMFRDIFHVRCLSVAKNTFVISAAKARARKKKLYNEPLVSFDVTVLMKVAGWRVKGNGGEE